MSRISSKFDNLRTQQRTALIPYITAGDPAPGVTVPLMHAMVAAGADVIELGVPFSDPMADGPVIQAACERALMHHVNLPRILEMVTEFRQRDNETPVVLMGYLNPIEVMGYRVFAEAAALAGVDGVLTVDLPPEEAHDLLSVFNDAAIDPIFLLAPTSSEDRIHKICAVSKGFVYYVSLKGVTGASTLNAASVNNKLARIRQITPLPIGVGFGIKDPASAAQVAKIADAVVVGSAIVNQLGINTASPGDAIPKIAGILREMRAAMDAQGPGEKVA